MRLPLANNVMQIGSRMPMHLQYEFSLVIHYYLNQSESVNVICHLKSFFMLKKQTFLLEWAILLLL